jgi:CheY-like chemotaxis protein
MAPKSILIVDDEPLIVDLLRHMLTSYQHQVQSAENGETALELFGKSTYDLVITDFRMPGIDGIQLAQRMRQRVPDQPILMLTGYLEPLSTPREQLPVNAVLPKPCTLDELRDAVLELFPDG